MGTDNSGVKASGGDETGEGGSIGKKGDVYNILNRDKF